MDDTTLNLNTYFQPPEPEAWRKAVEQTLKGRPFEKLIHQTLEGVSIHPLYSAPPSAHHTSGLPDQPPYTRGARTQHKRQHGWDVRAIYDLGTPQETAQAVAEDVERGVRSLWIIPSHSGRDGLYLTTAQELEPIVHAAKDAHIVLDAGPNGAAWLVCLLAHPKAHSLVGEVHIDPLGALARYGELPQGLDGAWDELAEAIALAQQKAPHLKVLGLSGLPYHDAGAHAAQELAMVLAAGVETLRQLEKRSIALEAIATQTVFQLAVGSHMFMDIAKLRAARLLWSKVLTACDLESTAQGAFIHACTTRVGQTQRDPWVNMLRGTAGCFAAAVAGADAITVIPFDRALGQPESLAQRVATNTQIVLEAEAHLTRVVDPAGGSWFLESLTDQLAREAWTLFQEIEATGGLAQGLISGSIAEQIATTTQARDRNIARRKTSLVGVSAFPNIDEPVLTRTTFAATPPKTSTITLNAQHTDGRLGAAIDAAKSGAHVAELTAALHPNAAPRRITPLPMRRYAEGWEALRDTSDAHKTTTGHRPRVFLANIGPIPHHKARAAFAARLFEAGGFTAIRTDGFTDPESMTAAFAQSEADGIVLCGADDDYATHAAAMAHALTAQQPAFIALAGRAGTHADAWSSAGIHHYVHIGCDALAVLTELQNRSRRGKA